MLELFSTALGAFGGGGNSPLSGTSGAAAIPQDSSGDALGYATGGNKVFNFGANPNAGLAGGSAVNSILSSKNLLIAGSVILGVAYLSRKKRR